MSRIVIEPGKRTELAMRYTILVFFAPTLIAIPFAKAFAKDLGIPYEQFRSDIGLAFLGFLIGPGVYVGVFILNAFLVTMLNIQLNPWIFGSIRFIWIFVTIYVSYKVFKTIFNRTLDFLIRKYS